MGTVENAIEALYRQLSDSINTDYIGLYESFQNEKLRIILATLHSRFVNLFGTMNKRLPTGDDGNHFWADPSRGLISTIEMSRKLLNVLSKTQNAIRFDEYYNEIFTICDGFLSQYQGSSLPPNMEKVELYYIIPIFVLANEKVAVIADMIKTVDRNYINSIAERANKDIDEKSYDSAITKCRTLLEEVFYYVIELRDEQPSDKGDIGLLYTQVKRLYGMHADKSMDTRIKTLLSGLQSIVSAVAEMRNKNSDAHGAGSKRLNIEEHHTRLFLNSAVAMSDFILSVGEKNKKAVTP